MSTHASQAAFVERLESHRGILLKVANTYCRDRTAREDLIQETILQLWRAYPRYDGRAAFSTWMYRIAVNVAISFHRSQMRHGRNIVPAKGSILESLADSTEQPDERLTQLREFIDRLDDLDRALMLLYLDDRPHAEIASILGISESNVGTKLGRIKQRLKHTATGEEDGT